MWLMIGLVKLMVSVLKLTYLPFKLITKKEKITIISRQSDKPTLDIVMLSEHLRKLHPEIITVVLTKKIGNSLMQMISYAFHMLNQLYHIASSKVVILDGYCIAASVLNHKKSTKILQMWHAMGAVKQFGYQTLDKVGGTKKEVAEAMCMHRNYDYIISPGGQTDHIFCDAFNSSIDKIIHATLPRTDYMLKEDKECIYSIRVQYDLNEDKEIILYLPTFRKNRTVKIEELIEAFDFENRILVVKMHPLDEDKINKNDVLLKNNEKIIIDHNFDSYQWLKICDRVITDYSALAVESTILMKPLYFYVYDYDEYEEKVGFNINIKEEMGPYSADNVTELMEKMVEEYDYDLLKAFRNKYITAPVEGSTEKLTDIIIDIMDSI